MNQSLDLAWQDLQSRKYRRALEEFQWSIEVEPVNSQAYLGLARCYNALRQPERAATAALKALELEPCLVDPHIVLASVYRQMHRFDESEGELQKAFELDPNSAYAHRMSGLLLLDEGQLQEALEHLKKAVAIEPEHSAHHNNLAMAYQKMGYHTAAAKEYRYALEFSRSFETVADVILGVVGYYRWAFSIFLLLIFVMRSIYTLPLILVSVFYMTLCVRFHLRRGKYLKSVSLMVLSLVVLALYVYNLLYGL